MKRRRADEPDHTGSRPASSDAGADADALSAVQSLRKQLEVLTDSLADARTELRTTLANQSSEISSASVDLRRHAGYIDVLRRNQKTIEQKLLTADEVRRDDLDGLGRGLRELRTVVGTAIQDQVEQSARTSMAHQDLSWKLDGALDAMVAERASDADDARASIAAASERADRSEQAAREAARRLDDLDAVGQSLRELRAAVTALHDKTETSARTSGANEELVRRVDVALAAINERADRLDESTSRAMTRLTDIDGLGQSLRDLRAVVSGVQEQTELTNRTAAAHDETLKGFDATLLAMSAQHQAALRETRDQITALAGVSERSDRVVELRQHTEERLEALSSTQDALSAAIDEIKVAGAASQARLAELGQRATRMSTELTTTVALAATNTEQVMRTGQRLQAAEDGHAELEARTDALGVELQRNAALTAVMLAQSAERERSLQAELDEVARLRTQVEAALAAHVESPDGNHQRLDTATDFDAELAEVRAAAEDVRAELDARTDALSAELQRNAALTATVLVQSTERERNLQAEHDELARLRTEVEATAAAQAQLAARIAHRFDASEGSHADLAARTDALGAELQRHAALAATMLAQSAERERSLRAELDEVARLREQVEAAVVAHTALAATVGLDAPDDLHADVARVRAEVNDIHAALVERVDALSADIRRNAVLAATEIAESAERQRILEAELAELATQRATDTQRGTEHADRLTSVEAAHAVLAARTDESLDATDGIHADLAARIEALNAELQRSAALAATVFAQSGERQRSLQTEIAELATQRATDTQRGTEHAQRLTSVEIAHAELATTADERLTSVETAHAELATTADQRLTSVETAHAELASRTDERLDSASDAHNELAARADALKDDLQRNAALTATALAQSAERQRSLQAELAEQRAVDAERGSEHSQRLASVESAHNELATHAGDRLTSVESAHAALAERTEALGNDVTTNAALLAATVSRNVDLLRGVDELGHRADAFESRLAELDATAESHEEFLVRTEAAVTVLGAEHAVAMERTDERFNDLAAGSDRLGEALRQHEVRLEAVDAARALMKSSLEQIGAEVATSQARLADLVARTDTLRAELAANAAATAAVMARSSESARTLEQLTQQGILVTASLGALQALTEEDRVRFERIFARLEPLAPALATVDRLDATSAEFADRLTAAELLLNQRDDLELQLDRAEAFERVVAEIDPDRYASRDDLDELRRLVDAMSRFDRAP